MTRFEEILRLRREERLRALDALAMDVEAAVKARGQRSFTFGSFATRQVHAASDLDVAIPGAMERGIRLALIRDIERIQFQHGIDVDVVFEDESPEFFEEVCRAD